MIDFFQPPPRWWIDSTIARHAGSRRIGDIARQIIHDLNGGKPNDGLAQQILADAPNYLYGDNAINGRTHALWALMQLGRDDELPSMLEPLQHACTIWFNERIIPSIPPELLLMATYANLRIGRIHDAMIIIVLCDRLHLNARQREELTLLVVSVPTEDRPSTTLFH